MTLIFDNLYYLIETYNIEIIAIGIIFVLILFMLFISISIKFKKFKKKHKKIIDETKDKNVEKMLCDVFNFTNETSLKNKEVEYKLSKIERDMQHCIQKVGVLRYNAFEDVGSELSFVVALLDNNDNGVVINGIYARENSTTYAKLIKRGNSKYILSAEEIQAIDIAKKSKNIIS
ncbi:DUF4446 family protein [Herbivorax sp. ANBcel31]|uniref:DUF4446 family protein n=1 Tax=Herbivorax sp. ANBcel31 TaxID=3069754 RepID=UPI0027B45999|nr:DUF4446 family protein [Herbivorax sp. ANBcel31]MDQ2086024.1 DUF4446 family protein [Herbivorax sp. ANBcel31]